MAITGSADDPSISMLAEESEFTVIVFPVHCLQKKFTFGIDCADLANESLVDNSLKKKCIYQ